MPAGACWPNASSCTSLSGVACALATWFGEQGCEVELSDTVFMLSQLLDLRVFTMYLPSSAGPVPMLAGGGGIPGHFLVHLLQEWLS